MPFVPFHERFPEVAEKETRSLTVFNHSILPEDEYALLEMYCDEPDCDCRRVFFNVLSRKQKDFVAVIAYGWASKKHYAEWLGYNDPDAIKELKGPALNITSPQSRLAPALLREVTLVLNDKQYVARLKRHYAMFRQAIDAEMAEEQLDIKPAPTKQYARNAPCPCGGGKKYKKCCGRPE